MRRILIAVSFAASQFCAAAFAGEAEIKAAQGTIQNQLEAFKAGNDEAAYSFAAPNVKKIFPSLDIFMNMVTGAYKPVHKPQNYAFGKVEESSTQIIQQVMIVGPDGKDYEAVYTLELQPDGVYRITGVSLRASNSLST